MTHNIQNLKEAEYVKTNADFYWPITMSITNNVDYEAE